MKPTPTKRTLRAQLRTRRRSTSGETITLESNRCVHHLLAFDVWKHAHTVGLYWPIDNELDPNTLLDHPSSASKRFAWPVSHPQTSTLTFHTLPSPRSYGFSGARSQALDLMQRDAYNIPAPVDGPTLDPATLDLLLVPALGFDPRGFRLGFGKGFYDRFLPSLSSSCVTVGFCGSWQLVDTIPNDGHDLPVQVVLTPQGIHATPQTLQTTTRSHRF